MRAVNTILYCLIGILTSFAAMFVIGVSHGHFGLSDTGMWAVSIAAGVFWPLTWAFAALTLFQAWIQS